MGIYMTEIFDYLPKGIEKIYNNPKTWSVYFRFYPDKEIKLNKQQEKAFYKLKDLLFEKDRKIKNIEIKCKHKSERLSKIIKRIGK